jgi:hypothetical protein
MISYHLLLASLLLLSYAKPIYEGAPNDIEGPHLAEKADSTSSSATSTTTRDVTVQTPVQRMFLDTDTCTEPQQTTINIAWQDAGRLATAAAGGKYVYVSA